MTVNPTLERLFHHLTGAVFAHRPRRLPAASHLRQCRIVSHRGEHDNLSVLENTLAAFKAATQAGVWGIEFDVRWTRDDVPVVLHDAHLDRMFRIRRCVADTTWRQLRSSIAAVPSLEEVVAHFGGQAHLMIEIKNSSRPNPRRMNDTLAQALKPLEPVRDFHIMSLTPQHLPPLPFLPPAALLAIAYGLPERFSRWVLDHNWGGLCGHYLLMRAPLVYRHLQRGQKIGTGFVNSRNCMYRELSRGVTWIFSDRAVGMQRILDPDLHSQGGSRRIDKDGNPHQRSVC
jgi:glycerophosphoryl diester phosphodiesterase